MLRSVVRDLAGAMSPLDELLPAIKGREHAMRLFRLQANEELNEEERELVSLYFDLSLELMTERILETHAATNARLSDVLEAVYPDKNPDEL